MKEHFVRLKVELLDCCEDGRMTPAMMNVYLVVQAQADYETGIWKGSAAKVFAAWGAQLNLRTIQRALESLCREGFLKSFHQPGQRHNYPVAINKYMVKAGKHKGYWLDANATTVPENPVYVPIDDENGTDSTSDRDTTATTPPPVLSRVLDTREVEKEIERERTVHETRLDESAKASLSAKVQSKVKSSREPDFLWIIAQMARNSWPVARQTDEAVREYLSSGHSRQTILKAIENTMESRPNSERQPGLYLAQNLCGHMERVIAREKHAQREGAQREPPCLPQSERPNLTPEELAEIEEEGRKLRKQLGLPGNPPVTIDAKEMAMPLRPALSAATNSAAMAAATGN